MIEAITLGLSLGSTIGLMGSILVATYNQKLGTILVLIHTTIFIIAFLTLYLLNTENTKENHSEPTITKTQ